MDVTLDGGALVAVIIIGAIQLGLVVWSLVDLFRRPTTSGLPRWAWVIVILLLNILGPILYFAIGRSRPTLVDDGGVQRHQATASPATGPRDTAAPQTSAPEGAGATVSDDSSRARRAVDSLYGPADRAGD